MTYSIYFTAFCYVWITDRVFAGNEKSSPLVEISFANQRRGNNFQPSLQSHYVSHDYHRQKTPTDSGLSQLAKNFENEHILQHDTKATSRFLQEDLQQGNLENYSDTRKINLSFEINPALQPIIQISSQNHQNQSDGSNLIKTSNAYGNEYENPSYETNTAQKLDSDNTYYRTTRNIKVQDNGKTKTNSNFDGKINSEKNYNNNYEYKDEKNQGNDERFTSKYVTNNDKRNDGMIVENKKILNGKGKTEKKIEYSINGFIHDPNVQFSPAGKLPSSPKPPRFAKPTFSSNSKTKPPANLLRKDETKNNANNLGNNPRRPVKEDAKNNAYLTRNKPRSSLREETQNNAHLTRNKPRSSLKEETQNNAYLTRNKPMNSLREETHNNAYLTRNKPRSPLKDEIKNNANIVYNKLRGSLIEETKNDASPNRNKPRSPSNEDIRNNAKVVRNKQTSTFKEETENHANVPRNNVKSHLGVDNHKCDVCCSANELVIKKKSGCFGPVIKALADLGENYVVSISDIGAEENKYHRKLCAACSNVANLEKNEYSPSSLVMDTGQDYKGNNKNSQTRDFATKNPNYTVKNDELGEKINDKYDDSARPNNVNNNFQNDMSENNGVSNNVDDNNFAKKKPLPRYLVPTFSSVSKQVKPKPSIYNEIKTKPRFNTNGNGRPNGLFTQRREWETPVSGITKTENPATPNASKLTRATKPKLYPTRQPIPTNREQSSQIYGKPPRYSNNLPPKINSPDRNKILTNHNVRNGKTKEEFRDGSDNTNDNNNFQRFNQEPHQTANALPQNPIPEISQPNKTPLSSTPNTSDYRNQRNSTNTSAYGNQRNSTKTSDYANQRNNVEPEIRNVPSSRMYNFSYNGATLASNDSEIPFLGMTRVPATLQPNPYITIRIDPSNHQSLRETHPENHPARADVRSVNSNSHVEPDASTEKLLLQRGENPSGLFSINENSEEPERDEIRNDETGKVASSQDESQTEKLESRREVNPPANANSEEPKRDEIQNADTNSLSRDESQTEKLESQREVNPSVNETSEEPKRDEISRDESHTGKLDSQPDYVRSINASRDNIPEFSELNDDNNNEKTRENDLSTAITGAAASNNDLQHSTRKTDPHVERENDNRVSNADYKRGPIARRPVRPNYGTTDYNVRIDSDEYFGPISVSSNGQDYPKVRKFSRNNGYRAIISFD